MLWSNEPLDHASDLDRDGAWRKKLISRLSDVQVALWANDPQSDDDTATAGRDPSIITPHLTRDAERETVFARQCAEALHKPNTSDSHAQTSSPGTFDAFSTWDQLDEDRILTQHARSLSSRYWQHTRHISILTGLSVLTVIACAGLISIILSNQDGAPEFSLAIASTPTAETDAPKMSSAITATIAAPIETTTALGIAPATTPAHYAADKIADLLATDSQLKDEPTRIAEFVSANRKAFLAPITSLNVSDTGKASFPFVLQSIGPDMQGARVMLHGLPDGVSLAFGAMNATGQWMFALAELPDQKLQVSESAAASFELQVGVILPQGTIVGAAPLHVKLDRTPSKPRVALNLNTSPPSPPQALVTPTATPKNKPARQSEANDEDDEDTVKPVVEQKGKARQKTAATRREQPMGLGATQGSGVSSVRARTRTEPIKSKTENGNSTGSLFGRPRPDWLPTNDH
jgi:hypothetical protein